MEIIKKKWYNFVVLWLLLVTCIFPLVFYIYIYIYGLALGLMKSWSWLNCWVRWFYFKVHPLLEMFFHCITFTSVLSLVEVNHCYPGVRLLNQDEGRSLSKSRIANLLGLSSFVLPSALFSSLFWFGMVHEIISLFGSFHGWSSLLPRHHSIIMYMVFFPNFIGFIL